MSERRTAPARLNKTSICSVVFLDIVEYSKKPDSEQIEYKNRFNALINEALKDIAQNDRIILDTGDGAAITLMGEPESALFTALIIRDGTLEDNRRHPDFPLYIRIGINVGPVQVVKDINNRLNVIGDGINVAQRVMNFAEANQILVSRSYYEIVSRLSNDIHKMFTYSGIKVDKHVREHEVYIIQSPRGDGAAVSASSTSDAGVVRPHIGSVVRSKLAVGLGLIMAVILGVAIFWEKSQPPSPGSQQLANSPPAALPSPAVSPAPAVPMKAPDPVHSRPEAGYASKKAEPSQADHLQNSSAPKNKSKPAKDIEHATDGAPPQQESSSLGKKEDESSDSGWAKFKKSVHQGVKDPTCTDVQRSMNQCK